MTALRPAQVCSALLLALDAAEGRRRMRKRDQTPDAIGLAVKRALLERVVCADPDAERFEACLLDYARDCEGTQCPGAVWAMARAVLEEWRLAHEMQAFAGWLSAGAPSADAARGARMTASARAGREHEGGIGDPERADSADHAEHEARTAHETRVRQRRTQSREAASAQPGEEG